MSILKRIQPPLAALAFLLCEISLVSFSARAANADSGTISELAVDVTQKSANACPSDALNAVTPAPESAPCAVHIEGEPILESAPAPEWVPEPATARQTISRSPLLTKRFDPGASPPAKAARRMGWFGIGARMGTTQLRLTPPARALAPVNPASGQAPISGEDMALRANLLTVTPTLHLGGSGYFFKFDFPLGHSQGFDTAGIGIYPLNLGWYFDAADLFPYLSLGGTASAMVVVDSSGSRKLGGGTAQLRASLGVKYFPAPAVGISVEVGYSKWAAGAMVDGGGSSGSAVTASDTGVAVSARGGLGSVVDLSIGIEWL